MKGPALCGEFITCGSGGYQYLRGELHGRHSCRSGHGCGEVRRAATTACGCDSCCETGSSWTSTSGFPFTGCECVWGNQARMSCSDGQYTGSVCTNGYMASDACSAGTDVYGYSRIGAIRGGIGLIYGFRLSDSQCWGIQPGKGTGEWADDSPACSGSIPCRDLPDKTIRLERFPHPSGPDDDGFPSRTGAPGAAGRSAPPRFWSSGAIRLPGRSSACSMRQRITSM